MKKILLLYNFAPERVKLVRRSASPLGCAVRSVSVKEQLQPVGALAGAGNFLHEKGAAAPEGAQTFSEEMLVIGGFSGEGIDVLIGALYAAGVGRVPYKAVITPTNAGWTGAALFCDIKAEHELMSRKR